MYACNTYQEYVTIDYLALFFHHRMVNILLDMCDYIINLQPCVNHDVRDSIPTPLTFVVSILSARSESHRFLVLRLIN